MNDDIKSLMRKLRVKQWQVAEKYGCAESTMCCKLRHKLPQEEKSKIFDIINQLAKEDE